MGIIDDIMAEDAAVFVDSDLSADVESIQYQPHGQATRTINVQVTRATFPDIGTGAPVQQVRIFVRRHATLGVASVNVQGDRIAIAMRKGGEVQTDRRPVAIEAEDAGGFYLLIQ